MPDDVYVFGAVNLKSKTTASGKERYRVEITGDSVAANLDPKALGRGPAEAIAEHLRKRVMGITEVAAAATLKARATAQRVFRGVQEARKASAAKKVTKASVAKLAKPEKFSHPKLPPKFGPTQEGASGSSAWVMKRYGGGRMGAMEPNQSDKLFNDSGRFAKSIAAAPVDDTWVVNVAANRFDPSTFAGGGAAIAKMYAKLIELVPEWGNPALLGDDLTIRRAINDSLKQLAIKVGERTAALKTQRLRSVIGLVRGVVGFGR